MPDNQSADYWATRYWQTVAEHDKEVLAARKHLGNKYKPVFDRILAEFTNAQNADRSNENSNEAPPHENSNSAPPSHENAKEGTP